MKKIILIITSLLLLCSFSFSALAVDKYERVYDKAGLLTTEQIADLETRLYTLSNEMNMDLILLTTDYKGGKSLRAYADDFYDQGNFGVGTNYDGALILLDMEERTVYMTTSGKAIKYFTDSRIYDITDGNDTMYNYLSYGDYYNGLLSAIDKTYSYYKRGIPAGQYNYFEDGSSSSKTGLGLYDILISIFGPAIAAFGAVFKKKREYSMSAERSDSHRSLKDYQGSCAFAFSRSEDQFLNSVVSRRHVPRVKTTSYNTGRSTVHTSSMGRSHGGGGGGRHF